MENTDMKVSINKEDCVGCGLCVDDCPDVFEMQEDVAAVKVEEVPEKLVNTVKEAAENCPVDAIIISE